MDIIRLSKIISLVVAMLWLVFISFYSAIILGATFHEYQHITAPGSKNFSIVVYADGSGLSKGGAGSCHDLIYFNNSVLESFIMVFSVFCILYVFLWGGFNV